MEGQGEIKQSNDCSNCQKHGIVSNSVSSCQFCFDPLCDYHLKIHSRFCPKSWYFCIICQSRSFIFCNNCENFFCPIHLQISHPHTKNHLFLAADEKLLEQKDEIKVHLEKEFQNKNQTQEIKLRFEGIHPNEPILTWREETVNKIIEELDKHEYLLILGPPFSGKTSLASLIKQRLEKSFQKSINSL